MPFVANTPESLLGRADSKNPNSTCRGLTASGRPCRRPVTAANAYAGASLFPPSRRPRTPYPRDESLYCWQHKEQASLSAHSSPGPRATATPILEEGGRRTSLDTLTDRLGLVELAEKEKHGKYKHGRKQNGYSHAPGSSISQASRPPKKKHEKKPSQLQFCFCFTIPIEETNDSSPPPRPQPQPIQPASASAPNLGRKSKQSHLKVSTASPAKSSRKSTASQTARLKDLIPNDLDTVTASALLSELAKPYTEAEEPGYIYMFWLTPDATAPTASSTRSRGGVAPADAARDLLAPPSPSPRSRRASDVVASYADTHRTRGSGGSATKKTMVLKIGRAANVQRRMNQWQRQCGRDVEVLRYYPYSPSSTDPVTPTPPPRPAPHAKRVERLVHIELAGRGLKADSGMCDACGREHREWFEIEASRAAVREVDGVIRRWVEWDEEVG